MELAQSILNHWKNVIPKCSVQHDPYDHFHLTNAFPDSVYDEILNNRLGDEHFRAFNIKRWKRPDGTSTRDMMFLSDDEIKLLDEDLRRFWSTLAFALSSDVFRQLVYTNMKQDIALRLEIAPEEVLNSEAFVDAWLLRDTQGYRIKPHPDGQPRVVTIMFYLPEDDQRQDLGTSVYEDRGKLAGLVGKRFKETYRFPFARNSMAAFAVNDLPEKRSIHGRELVESTGERNSILLAFTSKTHQIKNTDHWIPPTHHDLK